MRHQGGGHKQNYRIVDFRRNKDGIPAKVERLEYDPNRSANLALLCYADGERRYIIAPKGLTVGTQLVSGRRRRSSPATPCRCATSRSVPPSTASRWCLAKARSWHALPARRCNCWRGKAATPRCACVRVRFARVHVECRATIGEVGNEEHSLRSIGKAGAQRWRGIRPTVRGVAMNPIDHPHGGGEGKTAAGRDPVSPWGTPTKGYRPAATSARTA
jgi:large subunit ribosomal protein L2